MESQQFAREKRLCERGSNSGWLPSYSSFSMVVPFVGHQDFLN